MQPKVSCPNCPNPEEERYGMLIGWREHGFGYEPGLAPREIVELMVDAQKFDGWRCPCCRNKRKVRPAAAAAWMLKYEHARRE